MVHRQLVYNVLRTTSIRYLYSSQVHEHVLPYDTCIQLFSSDADGTGSTKSILNVEMKQQKFGRSKYNFDHICHERPTHRVGDPPFLPHFMI